MPWSSSQGPGVLEIIEPKNNTIANSVTVGKNPHWIARQRRRRHGLGHERGFQRSLHRGCRGRAGCWPPSPSATRRARSACSLAMRPGPPPPPARRRRAPPPARGGWCHPRRRHGRPRHHHRQFRLQSADPDRRARAGVNGTNGDASPHTITSAEGGWDSGNLATARPSAGSSTGPGRYPYACTIHPFMRGEIVVTG